MIMKLTGAILGRCLFDTRTISRGDQLPRDEIVLFVGDVATARRVCAGTAFTLIRGHGSRILHYLLPL